MFEVDKIRRDEIEVVYLGFDFEKLSPNAEDRRRVRAKFGFANDDLVIGYVANFAGGKGHIQLIDAFAKTGKVRWEIKSLTFLNSRGTGQESTLGAHGTFCAAEQGKFWQFHNALFANQFGEGRGAFALPRLKDMAGKLGMDGNTFEACMVSEKYKDTIVADTALATKFSVNSTPSFVINDGPTLAGARTVNDLKIEFGKLKPDIKFE